MTANLQLRIEIYKAKKKKNKNEIVASSFTKTELCKMEQYLKPKDKNPTCLSPKL